MKPTKGLGLLLAAALCLLMAAPVAAAEEKTIQEKREEFIDELIDICFHEGYNTTLYDVLYPSYYRISRNQGTQTRSILTSLNLDRDVTVAEFVKLGVAVNTTMTVDKDTTITVNGQLNVGGTVHNYGTIILDKIPDDHMDMETLDGELINSGTFINYGTIEVRSGRINNLERFENKGEIVIKQGGDKKPALRNSAKQESKSDTDKVFRNTGTIRLQSPSGFALENAPSCVFENNGSITKTAGAVVEGTLTGNQPAEKNNP